MPVQKNILPISRDLYSKKGYLRRYLLDITSTLLIRVGGASVIIFVALVFIYLFRQVIPLFTAPTVTPISSHSPAESSFSKIHLLSLERQNQLVMQLVLNELEYPVLNFYDVSRQLPSESFVVTQSPFALLAADAPQRRLLAIANPAGDITIVRHDYEEVYTTGKRQIVPKVSYPFGEDTIQLTAKPLKEIAILSDERRLTLVGYAQDGSLYAKNLIRDKNLLTGEIIRDEESIILPQIANDYAFIQLFSGGRRLLLARENGQGLLIDMENTEASPAQVQLTSTGSILTSITTLLGETSLLTADDSGTVSRWFLVSDTDGTETLQFVQSYDTGEPLAEIRPTENAKSFIALTRSGRLLLINAPSERTSLNIPIAASSQELEAFSFSPRADALSVIYKNGEYALLWIDNPHAEISFKRIWGKIWYENYDKPDWVWQSSSGSDDFEPKYGVIPLTFGTLKAAFYAMLFSAPLGIAAAIYTSFFMGPRLRRKIKPAIELMEAFPTVILGFIAGLVFAPFFEKHLPGIFSLLLLLPVVCILLGLTFVHLPAKIRHFLAGGWVCIALILPTFLLFGYLIMEISPFIESGLFGGDMRIWLADHGIDYNQRNALVVGVAMGLAVIPSIYSIAEDSLFSVPNNMVQGAYALGATPLQNVLYVIIPASLSGILSALMIGLGRAVGETMIVLMATGNTPIMDASIFTGLRTLAANIAVEMPESPVGSSHFRILFLCGFILFVFTFIINTLAEIVRQNIRKRYANV